MERIMFVNVHFFNHLVINSVNLFHKKRSRKEILTVYSHLIESFLFVFMHSTRYRFINV